MFGSTRSVNSFEAHALLVLLRNNNIGILFVVYLKVCKLIKIYIIFYVILIVMNLFTFIKKYYIVIIKIYIYFYYKVVIIKNIFEIDLLQNILKFDF